MKKLKKVLAAATVMLAAVTLGACSGNKSSKSSSSSNSYTPKELNVQFVPSAGADKLEARAKPMEKMLSDRLGGIPVHVTVSTSYNTVVEAMKSKKVDVGFLPPAAYVLAHKQKIAKVLLQAQRYGIKQPGGRWTKKLVSSYRGQIVAKKGSGIKSWRDLKGKSISIGEPTSDSSYIFPIAELKQKGLDVTKSCKLVTVTGQDQSILNVLNGDTDAAFTFEDARNDVKKDKPNIMNEVVPIYFTKPIPNDTISVRSDMSKAFCKKLERAFISIGKSKKGRKMVESIYDHEGYVPTNDSAFKEVRDYNKLLNKK